MARQKSEFLLEARGIHKRFLGAHALRGVDFRVRPGEVVALIGENGAGKSTLMKILAGVHTPDAGSLVVDGKVRSLTSPARALAQGVALIHQELALCPKLEVAANVFLGREPHFLGIVRTRAMRRRTQQVLHDLGARFGPERRAETLSVGEQQMVEIAKALSTRARMLIMDEPTASLSNHEAMRLFEVVRELRAKGVSIVYITHRLAEVCALADRVVVLRDGCLSGELEREQINNDDMVAMMVGRRIAERQGRISETRDVVALEVDEVRTESHPESQASFTVGHGEIVGIGGLVGSGRTELLRALFGLDPILGGRVKLHGKRLKARSPKAAMRRGLALVPEDRKGEGLLLGSTLAENISLAALSRFASLGIVRTRRLMQTVSRLTGKLLVHPPDPHREVQFLSGGNQQKAVFAKWLAARPKLLLLDEPTRGIDIGARHEIYDILRDLAEKGLSILFVSSELEELLHLADRILVMNEGRITGELDRLEATEEAIMHLATQGGPRRHARAERTRGATS